jgi:hypothetical protein
MKTIKGLNNKISELKITLKDLNNQLLRIYHKQTTNDIKNKCVIISRINEVTLQIDQCQNDISKLKRIYKTIAIVFSSIICIVCTITYIILLI